MTMASTTASLWMGWCRTRGSRGTKPSTLPTQCHVTNCMHRMTFYMLNQVIENNLELEEIGRGQLAALWKPRKLKGPVTNLRPVILLTVLRKILSNITLNRMKPSMLNHLSLNQCAYRPNRSTTDVVWAYR